MIFPRGDEYVSAVQNPQFAFSDFELKSSRVELNNWQLPKPYSGGFTTTFRLLNHSKQWAVRCFTKNVPDLKTRYGEISAFLRIKPASFFVSAEYVEQGIRISNKFYPIIKMQWLDGIPLNKYLEANLNNPKELGKLLNGFQMLIKKLEQLSVAHGDLQHGNILVQRGDFYLIDYDGMFLNSLASLHSNEIGHINYQHPDRTAQHNNSRIDRFSSIVIYLGIKALTIAPELWKKYDNDENILFKANDFTDFDNSKLIQDLKKYPALLPLIHRFINICKSDFYSIPSLDDFISGANQPKLKTEGTIVSRNAAFFRSQYEVINGSDKIKLMSNIGKKVEVIAYIDECYKGEDSNSNPYIFLNVNYHPNVSLKIVFWKQMITKFRKQKIDITKYEKKWIKITGVITEHKKIPNIIMDSINQIQILPNKGVAEDWLGKNTKNTTNNQQTNNTVIINNNISGRNNSLNSVNSIIQNNQVNNHTTTPSVFSSIAKPILQVQTPTIKKIVTDYEMVYVEGGEIQMGSKNNSEDESPIHRVRVNSFYMGKYLITQKEWLSVTGNNPSRFVGNLFRPIERVCWNDVQRFITKLNQLRGKNYRLPTEAEWEFAARGGNKSRGYKYAGSNNIDEVAWYIGNSDGTTHLVGTKKPNELEIYDMSGNVWEWCQDYYDKNYYSKSTVDNPKGFIPFIQKFSLWLQKDDKSSNNLTLRGCERPCVLRGGSWSDQSNFCNSTKRGFNSPTDYGFGNIGVRLVLDP